MPISPRKVFADAVAMLAFSVCPLCGKKGSTRATIQPHQVSPSCTWCAERQRVVETYKRWLLQEKNK